MSLKSINVSFHYEYIDKQNEKKKHKVQIITNGNFLMDKIRNINFFNEMDEREKKKLNNDNNSEKPKLDLCLPYSNNYVTIENLDIVVGKTENNNYKINNPTSISNLIAEYEPLMDDIKSIDNLDSDNPPAIITKDIIRNSLNFNSKSNIDNIIFNGININDENRFSYNNFRNFLINIYENRDNENIRSLKIKREQQSKFASAFNGLIAKIPSKNNYKDFSDKNYKKFFTIENGHNILSYFETLKENFNENINYDSRYSKNLNYKEITAPPENLNNKKDLIEIIYEFSKYLLKPNVYKKYKSDKKGLYDYVNKDIKLMKNIITYYNIFTILTKIYIIEDTIIETDNNDNEKNNLKYVKKIKCVNQFEKTSKKSIFINNTTLDVYFEIDYENINENNIIDFHINLINTENYKIKNLNKEDRDYINYDTKIFTLKSNIFNKIFFADKINYEKLIKDFYILKKKNPLFIKENPDNIVEALLNKEILNSLNNDNNSKYYNNKQPDLKDNELEKLLTNIFIHKIFFKKNNMLYLNNKFYTINNVDFSKKILINAKKYAKNNALDNKDNVEPPIVLQNTRKIENVDTENEMINFIKKSSDDIRLSIFNKNTTYTTYLNVYCFIKNSKDEKIKFKDKFNAILNCNDKADTLDLLFKKLLGETYNYNTFKNLIGNKGNKEIEETENKELIENKDIKKEKPSLDNIGNLQDDYLSAGGIKKNKLYKKNKIYKLEKKFKKNKRKNSYKNKRKNISNKTIKLINLYLKN